MEDIFTDFVLLANRVALHQDLQQRVIGKTFSLPLDSNSEYRYESACSAIAQFQLTGPEVDLGFDKLFAAYDSLQPDTKRVFLEALYAVAP